MNKWFVALIYLLLISCNSDNSNSMGYKEIDVSEFKNYGAAPLYHTLYQGSDSRYHYFAYSAGKRMGSWKIKKETMPFNCEFKLGQSKENFIGKADNGKYQPFLCE